MRSVVPIIIAAVLAGGCKGVPVQTPQPLVIRQAPQDMLATIANHHVRFDIYGSYDVTLWEQNLGIVASSDFYLKEVGSEFRLDDFALEHPWMDVMASELIAGLEGKLLLVELHTQIKSILTDVTSHHLYSLLHLTGENFRDISELLSIEESVRGDESDIKVNEFRSGKTISHTLDNVSMVRKELDIPEYVDKVYGILGMRYAATMIEPTTDATFPIGYLFDDGEFRFIGLEFNTKTLIGTVKVKGSDSISLPFLPYDDGVFRADIDAELTYQKGRRTFRTAVR